jgi:CRP/FNR family cyclic AMP-dependent transcriptional regulator
MLREAALWAELEPAPSGVFPLNMRRSLQPDFEAVFAARGWLAEHPAAFRTLLLNEGVLVDVRAGTCVFRREDESNGLYGIVSGAIGVEGGHRRQSPLLGHVFRNGEWFGIKAVLHGGPRELTFRALEPSQLLYVARGRLVPMMQANADTAIRVGQLAEIGSRLGSWIARDLLTPDAGRRLASVLFRVLGMGEVTPTDPGGFRLTHQQLGEMANLSRHHVGRKLAMFEAEGWIACGYNRIRLLDAEGLAAFAYGDEEG